MDKCCDHSVELYSNSNVAKLMIRVTELHKAYENKKVRNGVSTTFETGKTNLVIGPMGSGDTVVLKGLLCVFG